MAQAFEILLINDVYIVVFFHGIAGDVFIFHIKHVNFSIWMRLDYVLKYKTFIIHSMNVNKLQQVHYLCLWCRISCSIVTPLYIERHRKGYQIQARQCKLRATYINRKCVFVRDDQSALLPVQLLGLLYPFPTVAGVCVRIVSNWLYLFSETIKSYVAPRI